MEIGTTYVSQYNPIIGRNEWTVVGHKYDYNQEVARSGYADMLHDDDRNVKYEAAINFTIGRLKREYPDRKVNVLDIGTGTGLLSMMAVRAGADTVTACEAFTPIAKCARNILKANNFQDKVKLVFKRSTDLVIGVDMLQKANVLISELFDTELIGEDALRTYKHASEHLLTTDAVLIPSAADLYLQVIESSLLCSYHRIIPSHGDETFDLEPFCTIEMETCNGLPSVFDIQASQLRISDDDSNTDDSRIKCLLDVPVLIKRFAFGPCASDIKLMDQLNIESYADGRKLCTRTSGVAHAFVVWWKLQMEPTDTLTSISTAPDWILDVDSAWRDHWMQAIYFSKIPYFLKKDQHFVIQFAHDLLSMRFDIFIPDTVESHSLSPGLLDYTNLPLVSCHCGLHYAWSRTRMSELNSSMYKSFTSFILKCFQYVRRLSTKPLRIFAISDCTYIPYLIGRQLNDYAYYSEVFHIDACPSSLSFMNTIYKLFDSNSLSVKVFPSITELVGYLRKCDVNTGAQTNVLFAEPFIAAALLPWHSVYFWYAYQELYSYLPHETEIYRITPIRLRIYSVLVDFDNLWRIRYPVNSCCGKYKMDLFDNLILEASARSDASIEPHPLWEYPGRAKSNAEVVFDMELVNDREFGEMFSNARGSFAKYSHHKLKPIFPSVNGLAFWAEWLYVNPESPSSENWFAPAGPAKNIEPNELIVWKQCGPQQGVFLAPPDWNVKFSSTSFHLNEVAISVDFNLSSGVPSISIDAVNIKND